MAGNENSERPRLSRAERRERERLRRRKQLDMLFMAILVVEVLIFGVLFLGYRKWANKDKGEQPTSGEDIEIEKISDTPILSEILPETTEEVTTTEEAKVPKEAVITVMGDVMMHEEQIVGAYNSDTDSFDVAPSFVYMKDYMASGDYTIANLETTLPGRNNGPSSTLGYAGYPCFSSPEILANNLQDCGVDLLQTTNNHAMDATEQGLFATIDYLDSIGIAHTGTFRSKAEQDEPLIIEVNGITFGIVAYTYGTNGIRIDDDKHYCINTLTNFDTLENYDPALIDEMCDKVRALDEAGVDFVCPLIHFGTEYIEYTDSWQDMVVDRLFQAGADVIFGGHPHVVEPMDYRTIVAPDGSARKGWVVYSFGNFISMQNYDGVNKDFGFIGDFRFTVDYDENGNEIKELKDVRVEPTYVRGAPPYSDRVVIPVLKAYNHASDYSFLSDYDWNRINIAKDHVVELLCSWGNLSYKEDGDEFLIYPTPESEKVNDSTTVEETY